MSLHETQEIVTDPGRYAAKRNPQPSANPIDFCIKIILEWIQASSFRLSVDNGSFIHPMISPKPLPYGSWPSPVEVDATAKQSTVIESIVVDNSTKAIYHSERRPTEGRTVIVRSTASTDVTKAQFNARTLVDGYGGNPMVVANDVMFFSNIPDNRLYKIESSECLPVTHAGPELRYADLCIHPIYANFLACVLENQCDPLPVNVINSLAVVNVQTGETSIISSGWDFYAGPAFSPDGKRIAFLRWSHPYMPWQFCQLVCADVVSNGASLSIRDERIISGDSSNTSAQQPMWTSDGKLLFMSDKRGWIELWMHVQDKETKPILSNLVQQDFAEPLWRLGDFSYAILDNNRVICCSIKEGESSLSLVYLAPGTREIIDSPFIAITAMRTVDSQSVVFVGTKADEGGAVVKLTVNGSASNVEFEIVIPANEHRYPLRLVPVKRVLKLYDKKGRPLFADFYPPTNPSYVGVPGERPPCLINVHGGPTSRQKPGFDPERLLYTSRGFAWIDIHFGGSTGYGKEYMERLNGNWGLLDPQDCACAAQQAIAMGLIDEKRVIIRGGSAGGYNVLQSLINFPNLYVCGTSYFGIANLKRLHDTTHKFQSHYIPGLMGGTPEEVPEVYKTRSPLFQAGKIQAPLLLQHGILDFQVPVEQTESIAKAVRGQGTRVDLVIYEGEGHGFRLEKTIRDSRRKELAFYEEILNL